MPMEAFPDNLTIYKTSTFDRTNTLKPCHSELAGCVLTQFALVNSLVHQSEMSMVNDRAQPATMTPAAPPLCLQMSQDNDTEATASNV